MAKVPVLRPREIEHILRRAGFVIDTKVGSHRTYYNPETKRHTTVAFHPGTVPRPTLKAIINQSGMTVDEFLKLK